MSMGEPALPMDEPFPVADEHDLDDGRGPAPALRPWEPPARRRSRAPLVTMAAVLVVLAAVALGVRIGTVAPSRTTSGMAAIAAKVDPGLVDIATTLSDQTGSGAGTGMVVTSSGEVFTNNHVIESETSLRVRDVGNGRTYAATVVGYDATADVAVLQMIGASHLRTVTFANAPARAGQAVVAVGNAGGKGGAPTAASGTVTGVDQKVTAEDAQSGRTEHLSGLVRTSVPIQAGDSGGPLVDSAGAVVGMDTAGTASVPAASRAAKGFAVPIGTVRAVGADIEHAEPSPTVHVGPTAFLGIEVGAVTAGGASVEGVLTGTGAATTGIRPGDTIVALDGHGIHSTTTLAGIMQDESPGATVPISWVDGAGRPYTATVTLSRGPPL